VTGSAYPPSTSLRYVATPSNSRPGYLGSISDPTWGTKVTRVTDANTLGSSVVRHAYARAPVWNADESLLLLGYSYPGYLLDGQTLAYKGRISQPAGATWSNTDRNILYGTAGGTNKFVSMDVRTGAYTTLGTFSGYSTVTLGEGEGGISNNDRFAVLQARGSNGNALFVFDIPARAIRAKLDLGSRWPNWAGISGSGQHVVVGWSSSDGSARYQGLEQYDNNLGFVRHLWDYSRHGDFALNGAGEDIFVMVGAPATESWRLSDGARTRLLPADNAFGSGHASGRNVERPGWVYLSVYEARPGFAGDDQVVAVKTDGSGTVQVFAHAHHRTSNYQEMTMAVPDRDGTRVVFASEWGGSLNTYVARMP
jgi:hypothetical protein